VVKKAGAMTLVETHILKTTAQFFEVDIGKRGEPHTAEGSFKAAILKVCGAISDAKREPTILYRSSPRGCN
jgi:hypothetical protein